VDRAAAEAGAAAAPVAPIAAGTETVLVAEDEEGVRSLLRVTLESYGYAVLEARNGEEAVRVGAGHPGPVDLLVADVVMPRMGGRLALGGASCHRTGPTPTPSARNGRAPARGPGPRWRVGLTNLPLPNATSPGNYSHRRSVKPADKRLPCAPGTDTFKEVPRP